MSRAELSGVHSATPQDSGCTGGGLVGPYGNWHQGWAGVGYRWGQLLEEQALIAAADPVAPPLPLCTTDRVRLNWVLKSISTTPAGLYKLDYDTPAGPASLTARSVAMTIPAWALADLLKDKVCL